MKQLFANHYGKVISSVLVLIATSTMILMWNIVQSAADNYVKSLVLADITSVRQTIAQNHTTLELLKQKTENVDDSLDELKDQQQEANRDVKEILRLMIRDQRGN